MALTGWFSEAERRNDRDRICQEQVNLLLLGVVIFDGADCTKVEPVLGIERE